MATREEILAGLTAPNTPFVLEDKIINGVPLRVYANAPRSMRDIFAATIDSADRPYLMYQNDVVTFGEAQAKVASVANWLMEQGVKKGDRIAIGMRNYPEWVLSYWATLSVGAIVVSLNAWWITEELDYALSDSGARFLIVDGERHDRISDEMQQKLGIEKVVVVRAKPRGSAIAWDDIASHSSGQLPTVSLDPEDDCTILYTSGTTGFPKGAVATHRNHITNVWNTLLVGALSAELAATAGVSPTPPPPVSISLWTFPFFHIAGVSGMSVAAAARSALCTQYKWDPLEALQLIQQHRITAVVGVPTVVRSLLEHPDANDYDLSSLITISQGGAPVPPDSIKKIEGEFERKVGATNGYGLTETTSAIAVNAGLAYFEKSDSVGLPVIGADIRIVDEDGHDVPDGQVGELWVRSPNNVRGYWNKPEETAKAFVDGWFKSGDAARRDPDGYIYVVDRIKDVVLRGGENVYCAEVEAVLFEHEAVGDVAVIGIPHESLGEEVAAVIVPKSGSGVKDTEDVRAYATAKLAGFKVPVKYFWQEEPLPRNATGKVLKKDLRDAYRNS